MKMNVFIRNMCRRLLIAAFVIVPSVLSAQDHAGQSVLSQHTWHKMSVIQEGIYKLDYAALQSMNIDVEHLNPNEIRIFGNPAGALPEKTLMRVMTT